ncbi:hypothetical protein LRP88_05557 [Fusarium phalaenopsidis]
MSVSFSSQKEYTIKIYSGSVNAISGELAVDPTEAPLHRLNLIQGGSFTQNYTLVPPQGSESQVTGHDTVGMLHFEISRLDLSPTESYETDDTLGDHKVQDGDTIHAFKDRHSIVECPAIQRMETVPER